MYKLFNLIFFFFFFTINAQIHEVGVFVGGSNYIGDVGPTNYISPIKPAFGILYKWNKSPRHSYRFSYTQSKISANDLDSKETSRNRRGYHFENSVKEVSLGLEFNFFEFNLHEIGRKFSPYVYSGLSLFSYNELYVLSGETLKDKKAISLAIPINLGIKTNVMPQLILALEVEARYTLTDNLDGSNPKNKIGQFGNINNNDWYVFSGITLTYTFGITPCYCVE
ncbi:DUF6089 family protein [uncultured Flavobacterium sp.]|jgi:hypothetical protein|uniref:type IX secretion system protein PorG n=1 Tax=uncultured Flavobacterium sp. TaxID=165435 RepID=UPI0030CA2A45